LSGKPKISFPFSEFTTVNRYNAVIRTLIESTNIITDNGAFTGFFDTINKAQVKSSMLGTNRGGKFVGVLPSWLDRSWSPLQQTAKSLGLGADPLAASGYMMKDPEATTGGIVTANSNYNKLSNSSLIDAYLQTTLNEKSAQNIGILKGGITFDIAPGSLVQTEMPMFRYPNESTYQSYFGMAWAVCIIMDGTAKTGTWVTLRNVRTENEQANVPWSKHPMYDKRFVRAPINHIRGLTNDIELG